MPLDHTAGYPGSASPLKVHLFWLAAVMVSWTVMATIPNVSCAQPGSIGPYVAFHSLETDEPGDTELRIFRIPINLTLRQWSNERWGMRLRLEATIATTDSFRFLKKLLDELRVTTIVPGMEFIFPVGSHHKLKPFFDLGFGTNDATNDVNLLGDLGIRTEFIFPGDKLIFGLEPGVKLSANTGDRIRNNTAFNGFVTLMALHTINHRVAGYLPDAGVYVEGGYDNMALEFSSVTVTASDLSTRYEAGLTFGFARGVPKIGPVRLPRLRVGYRFGDVTGFRFRLGGDWLTVLSEPL
jgi:hypothetical protein